MHRAVELGLVALLATGWLVAVSEPAEQRPPPGPPVEEAAWWTLESTFNPVHFPVKLDWQPPQAVCAHGMCSVLMPLNTSAPSSVLGGTTSSVIFDYPGTARWNVSVSVIGTRLWNGLQPSIAIEKIYKCSASGNATKEDEGAYHIEASLCYAELKQSAGVLPFALDVHDIALDAYSLGLRLTLSGVPPPDATGLIQAMPWHLEGSVEAVSLTPSN